MSDEIRHLRDCNGEPCECGADPARFTTRLTEERCPVCGQRLPVPKIGLLRSEYERLAPAHYRREPDERVRVLHPNGAECVIEYLVYGRLVEAEKQRRGMAAREPSLSQWFEGLLADASERRRLDRVVAAARQSEGDAGATLAKVKEGRGMSKSVPVFYTPKMVADSESYSPSSAKPAQVVASWQRQFAITIIEPVPVTIDEFARAHDAEFVRAVLAGECANGFGNRSPAIARSLPYTSGAMLSAARHVLASGGAAAAPCSGFHHAGYGPPATGFCTFNGLMVTALALKHEGARRVGILDLDMHYGDGTDEIIRKCEAHSWVRHFTGGAKFTEPEQAAEFFEQLPDVLASMAGCDICLFQAGADPHVDDPQGGWLTTEELRRRDAMVFDALHRLKIPVAWNLAGGYQMEPDGSIPKVLEIHDNTMRECVRVYA